MVFGVKPLVVVLMIWLGGGEGVRDEGERREGDLDLSPLMGTHTRACRRSRKSKESNRILKNRERENLLLIESSFKWAAKQASACRVVR